MQGRVFTSCKALRPFSRVSHSSAVPLPHGKLALIPTIAISFGDGSDSTFETPSEMCRRSRLLFSLRALNRDFAFGPKARIRYDRLMSSSSLAFAKETSFCDVNHQSTGWRSMLCNAASSREIPWPVAFRYSPSQVERTGTFSVSQTGKLIPRRWTSSRTCL